MIMKLLLLICFLAFQTSNLSQLRQLYHLAPTDSKKANQLLAIAGKGDPEKSVYLGYKGAARMMQAKHAFNPISKWNLFKDGKKILESAIASDPNNIELRYLRLTIKSNVPSFLGYSDKIATDKAFLLSKLNSINDKELHQMVTSYLDKVKK
jgi:hypothetical protein